jgi:hypothetical protein
MEFRGNAALLGTSLLLSACGSTTAGGSVSANASTYAPAPCPGRSFEEFLQSFASDEKTRSTFTADQVSVTDYRNPDALEQSDTVTTKVSKSEYRDFTLKYADNAYHNVDAAGAMDPAPVNIEIERRGPDYLVSYVYGMSEGNSWVFQPSGTCWVLAADPTPPTP